METPTHPRTSSSPITDPQRPGSGTPAAGVSANSAGPTGSAAGGDGAAYGSTERAIGGRPSSSKPDAGSTGQAAEAVKERAGAYWDDAREAARSKLNEQKDVAAGGISEVAGALREAAQRQRNDGAGQPLAQLTSSAAEGLEHLSHTLRSKDVGTMLRDMDTFARNQPAAFFGMALVAGFVAVRFLKAGND